MEKSKISVDKINNAIKKIVEQIYFSSLQLPFIHQKNNLAERKGFEPSIPISQNTRFPSARLKPLGHLS